MNENTVAALSQKAGDALKSLGIFLRILILGIVVALLYAIPWLLRAAAVVGWLVAGYIGITTIDAIYAPYSPSIPLLALQFAVIIAMVAWSVVMLIANPKHIWGGLAAGGLVLYGLAHGANWMMAHWQYANLFFRVLPPALFSAMLLFETIRLRLMRQAEGKIAMSGPAFIWLKNLKGGGG